MIADSNGCTVNRSATIAQPAQLDALINTVQISCHGEQNGAVNISALGGTPPYSYAWSNGATTNSITALDAGNYTLYLTDQNACADTLVGTIVEPLQLELVGSSTADSLNSSGTATVTATGGVPPYAYSWSNGETTPLITGVAEGFYSVTAIDGNGCTERITIRVGASGDALLDPLLGFSAYPNPVVDQFYINLSLRRNTPISIRIYEYDARLIYDEQVLATEEFQKVLDFRDLTSGMYIIRIESESFSLVRKLIKI